MRVRGRRGLIGQESAILQTTLCVAEKKEKEGMGSGAKLYV